MTNNDVFRRLRFIFDFSDDKMMQLFESAGTKATRAQISDWLKKDDHESYRPISDRYLAVFLNGIIIEKRGKREGPPPKPEERLNNNIILRKLKIALNLKDHDILSILAEMDQEISKHELSAFFRKPGQRQYRACLDQVLRNFIYGLQIRYR